MKHILKVALGAAALGLVGSAASAATLDDVKARGVLKCAVNTGLAGFAAPNDQGEYSGFDVDYCKALAAAIFNDVTKVEYTPTSAKDRFEVLANKTVDVLVRNTTWTLSRDTTLGFNFSGVNYYDGQGFMINAKKPGITSALQLSGASSVRPDRNDHRTQPRRLLQVPTISNTIRSCSRSGRGQSAAY